MSTDLALLNDVGGALAPSKYADDQTFDVVAKQSVFLPRIQLYGSNSMLVKRGKFAIGHYGLVQSKDNVVDLTSEFNCLVLAWRPKALRIDGDDTKAWYNPESGNFKSVVEEANKGGQTGNMFGPEFLVYVPDLSEFATFFFGNPTFRRASPQMKALLQKAATIASELIEKKKFSWHGPVITQCTAPLVLPAKDSPESAAFLAKLREESTRFGSPPEEEAELAPDAAGSSDNRAR